MNRFRRPAAMLTLAFTYIALWIAFVITAGQPLGSDRPLRWPLSLATIPLLMGMLFLALRVAASVQGSGGWSGDRYISAGAAMAIAALVTIGTMLGLVASLRVVLWGGPDWLRWTIVGLATVAVLIGSGRAMVYAALGGLIWGALVAWIGIDRGTVARTDLVLTALMVGTTLGALGGTL